jgi:hypothetical protein
MKQGVKGFLRKSNILSLIFQYVMFEALLKQVIVFSTESFGVWVPLAFGLAVGLAFAVISGARRSS